MPKFFFNLQRGTTYKRDREGTVLPDLLSARREALRSAKFLMVRALFAGDMNARRHAFEVVSEDGCITLAVPFREALARP
jgi:hypothetical protein